VIAEALAMMHAEMASQIGRLRDLSEVNDHIKPEEINALVRREGELAEVIASARVRLDAVRLIWKAPL
jgi:ATP-dependent helicase HepA